MAPSFFKLLVFAGTSAAASLAAVPVEELAKGAHVPVDMIVDILSTTDYASVNIDDWAPLLQQPVEAIKDWPADVKEHVFSELAAEVSDLVAPKAERRELTTRNESIRAVERQLLSVHNARIQSGRNGCFQNVPCGTCVVAAGLLGSSAIAGCVGTALAAVAGSAGVSTPVAIAGLTECGLKVASTTTAAIGVCHSAL
ncbi:hypothetical protein ACJ41O_007220 [Fusarium nematophilum]